MIPVLILLPPHPCLSRRKMDHVDFVLSSEEMIQSLIQTRQLQCFLSGGR